jgi:hypothetical protein
VKRELPAGLSAAARNRKTKGPKSARSSGFNHPPRKLLVGEKEAREALGGISRSTMASLLRRGDVRSVKIRRRRLIPIAELERVARQGVV